MGSALPFSVSDILERIIPGIILLAVFYLTLFRHFTVDAGTAANSVAQPVLWLSFLAASYACGVIMNTISSYAPIPGARAYWNELSANNPNARHPETIARADKHKLAIRDAIEEHFGVDVTDNSWKLCFGTVAKHGYSSNTLLFQGLEVFSRSMMAVCALAFGALVVKTTVGPLAYAIEWADLRAEAVLCIISLIGVFQFRRSAKSFSQGFVASIYEGFYSWYVEYERQPCAATEGKKEAQPHFRSGASGTEPSDEPEQ